MADGRQQRNIGNRIGVRPALIHIPPAFGGKLFAGRRLVRRLIVVEHGARVLTVVIHFSDRAEAGVSTQHLANRADDFNDRCGRNNHGSHLVMMELDFFECLRETHRVNRVTERGFNGCFKKGSIHAFSQVTDRFSHLVHPLFICAFEQIGKVDEDGHGGSSARQEAGVNEGTLKSNRGRRGKDRLIKIKEGS